MRLYQFKDGMDYTESVTALINIVDNKLGKCLLKTGI